MFCLFLEIPATVILFIESWNAVILLGIEKLLRQLQFHGINYPRILLSIPLPAFVLLNGENTIHTRRSRHNGKKQGRREPFERRDPLENLIIPRKRGGRRGRRHCEFIPPFENATRADVARKSPISLSGRAEARRREFPVTYIRSSSTLFPRGCRDSADSAARKSRSR